MNSITKVFSFFLTILSMCSMVFFSGCNTNVSKSEEENNKSYRLITLDPGHFHAALIQKSMLDDVDSVVYVYAPEGEEVKAHLALIDSYNNRSEQPTFWNEQVYLGEDYLEKMLSEKFGNIVILAGNNRKKTNYIYKSINSGLNVLADKPMAITKVDFELLRQAFSDAKEKGVFLYDIMTERYEIYALVQKELSEDQELFGELEIGSLENPAIAIKSVHHYYKQVSGAPLKRPLWYYDVEQAGEGIVDITTHYVDMVQWQSFPEQIIDYQKDIELISATRWPTKISREQYRQSTGSKSFPDYLEKDRKGDELHVFANGEMNYRIKGIHAQVGVEWNFQTSDGAGDTKFSLLRGSKANLVIRQGVEQAYQPKLFIEPKGESFSIDAIEGINNALKRIKKNYPKVEFQQHGSVFQVVIPDEYKEGHEAHFTKVAQKYLTYLNAGSIPDWEISNMISKYYTTTEARELALKNSM